MEWCEEQNCNFGLVHIQRKQDGSRVNTVNIGGYLNAETWEDIKFRECQQRFAIPRCTKYEHTMANNFGALS